jgi:anti-sigma factor RsiW
MSSANCIQEIQLSAYVDEELSANEMKQVEAHLVDCRHCNDACERMRVDRDYLLECMPEVAPPEYVKQRLFHQINTLAETGRPSGIRPWIGIGSILSLRSRAWMAACASVVLFAAIFSVFQYQRRLEDKRILAEFDRTRAEWMTRDFSKNPFDIVSKRASLRISNENPFQSYLEEH